MATTLFTTAPSAYDYGDTFRIIVMGWQPAKRRPLWQVVTTASEQSDSMQQERYQSGNYLAVQWDALPNIADLIELTSHPDERLTVTTTAGEKFDTVRSRRLAWDVFERFGYDLDAAAAAWRRLMENGTTPHHFAQLLGLPEAVLR